jgi:hypothetical protein
MTRKVSRNEKSQQSGSAGKEKMASSALLAAVFLLSSSLGVTAAQSAVEVTAAKGNSTHGFSIKLAETKTTVHTNELKTNPTVSQKGVSKDFSWGSKPKPGPQAKPKR